MRTLGEKLCRQSLHVDAVQALERSLAKRVLVVVAVSAKRDNPTVAWLNSGPAIRTGADVRSLNWSQCPTGATSVAANPLTMRGRTSATFGLRGFARDTLR
jgi:hypothetical protein